MKTPHLATVLLATAGICGNSLSWENLGMPQAPRPKSRYGVSQRIIRKNRRRAWAAGNRKAFRP